MWNTIFYRLLAPLFRVLISANPIWPIIFVAMIIAQASKNSMSAYPFLAIAIVFCIIVIGTRLRNIYYSFLSVQWPSTGYKIVNSKIDYCYFRGSESPHNYNVFFELEYDVRGVIYKLPQGALNSSRNHSAESDASRYLEEISTKTDAKVYFHPEKPRIAYVKTGVAVSDLVIVVMYGLFAIIALMRLIQLRAGG